MVETVTGEDRSGRPKGGAPTKPVRARELQDPLNHYLYHPLAWRLALLLAKTPITPNMVSVCGGLLVVAAAFVYAQQVWPLTVLAGLVLHMGWHVVDGADGDLARITGKASPKGELVDGICDYSSHIVLYFIMVWVLLPQLGWIAWPIMLVAGISHAVQSNHVEVQRRQYQWWVYGTPWLRNTHNNAGSIRKMGFAGIVAGYLRLASGMTPYALQIDAAVANADPAALEHLRAEVRREAPPLLLMQKFLGPNPRALVLGTSMLAGSPLYYFIYQAVVLNILLAASVMMHNAAAKRIVARL